MAEPGSEGAQLPESKERSTSQILGKAFDQSRDPADWIKLVNLLAGGTAILGMQYLVGLPMTYDQFSQGLMNANIDSGYLDVISAIDHAVTESRSQLPK